MMPVAPSVGTRTLRNPQLPPIATRMKTKKRTRRTPEQKIADLKAKIERIKARAAQAKVKKDPTLRHISGAVRAIDKAAAATKDAVTRHLH